MTKDGAYLNVPIFDGADNEVNTLGQIIWLLEQRAYIAQDLAPAMFADYEKRRMVAYLQARYAP